MRLQLQSSQEFVGSGAFIPFQGLNMQWFPEPRESFTLDIPMKEAKGCFAVFPLNTGRISIVSLDVLIKHARGIQEEERRGDPSKN